MMDRNQTQWSLKLEADADKQKAFQIFEWNGNYAWPHIELLPLKICLKINLFSSSKKKKPKYFSDYFAIHPLWTNKKLQIEQVHESWGFILVNIKYVIHRHRSKHAF